MKDNPTILVVDDDAHVRDTLQTALENIGYQVLAVADGQSMFDILEHEQCSLVLLDLVLPGEDGLSIARSLREKSSIPLIMMTGKGDETDKILGLEIAADDFIMKPFNTRELIARVRSLLRRTTELSIPVPGGDQLNQGHRVEFNGWVAYLGSRELLNPAGQHVTLTFGEFNLLEVFLNHPNVILDRERLIESTRRYSNDVFDRTIDVLILRLRRKIESNPGNPQLICTERGMGYIFKSHVVRY